MKPVLHLACLAGLVMALPAARLAAQQTAGLATGQSASAMFDQLFGREFQLASASATTADDLALAKRMLEIAGQVTETPDFFALLCQRIHGLTWKVPDGFETALASQQLLAEHSPAHRLTALLNIVELYQRAYSLARGDHRLEIAEKLLDAQLEAAQCLCRHDQPDQALQMLRRAQALALAIRSPRRAEVQQRFTATAADLRRRQLAQRLSEKLQQDPSDRRTAAELVNLYLIELDQPARAGLYTLHLDDADLQEKIALACKLPDKLTDAERLTLGDWYSDLAERAPSDAKARMYERAAEYLQAFLDGPTDPKDVRRIKAQLLLKQAREQIARLSPRPAPQSWSEGAVMALTFEKPTIQTEDQSTFALNPLGSPPKAQLHDVQFQGGLVGQAVRIGTQWSSYIDTHLDASGNTFSFAFWAKADPAALTTKGGSIFFGIYREDNRFYVGYNSHRLLNLGWGKSSWDTQPSDIKLDTEWHFYTLVRSTDKLVLYLDGKAVLTRTGPSHPSGPLYLGSCNHDAEENKPAYPLPGLFDEFAAWDRPLTDRQVADLYRYTRIGRSFCTLLIQLKH